MSDYTLAVYVWSTVALSGVAAPLFAFFFRETAKAAHLPLPCVADAA